jgi:hypothetical protein
MLRIAIFRRMLLALLLIAPAAAPAPARAQQLDQRIYLPALYAGVAVSVSFGSGYDQSTGQLTGAATSFAYGAEQIIVQTRVSGGKGLVLRREIVNPRGEKAPTSNILLDSDSYQRTVVYCLTEDGTCASGRLLLERGSYAVRVYLGAQSTAAGARPVAEFGFEVR